MPECDVYVGNYTCVNVEGLCALYVGTRAVRGSRATTVIINMCAKLNERFPDRVSGRSRVTLFFFTLVRLFVILNGVNVRLPRDLLIR